LNAIQALGKSLDPGWIHNADDMSGIMQVEGQGIAIGTRSFQASMNTVNLLLLKPQVQGLEALPGVFTGLVLQLATHQQGSSLVGVIPRLFFLQGNLLNVCRIFCHSLKAVKTGAWPHWMPELALSYFPNGEGK
jgi:hypothetical protein